MLAILTFFLKGLLAVLIVSAFCGLVAFFLDLHRFKGEMQMSLPRAKLIQSIIEAQELERQKKAETNNETENESEVQADEKCS